MSSKLHRYFIEKFVHDHEKIRWSFDDGIFDAMCKWSLNIVYPKLAGVLYGITHHRYESTFATCGDVVTLWDANLRHALNEYSWGMDSVHKIRFNPVETSLLAGCASDNSIILYDTRENRAMRKVVLDLKSNDLSWNPMEAFVFAVANEDYNSYAFDLRNLKRPLNVHMDHTAAVISINYSPTGKEFVTGSYDKTIR